MKRGLQLAGLCAVMLGLAVSGRAAEGVSDVEMLLTELPIAVASTKSETIFKTVSTVTIIDQAKIKAYNFRTVSEAVATVPGFEVIRTQFLNTVPMARGILMSHYANKILVMINNVPTWFTVTGEGFLDRVNIHEVDRIEVLKGPASVLYGTNAYAGVVNIILKQVKKGAESSGQVHGSIGTEQTYSAGGNYAAQTGDLGLLVAGNGSTEKGKLITFQDELGEVAHLRDTRYPKGGNFTFNGKLAGFTGLFNGYRDEFLGLEGGDPRFNAGAGHPHNREGYLANLMYARTWEDQFDLQASATFDWNQREFSRAYDSEYQRAITSGSRSTVFAKGGMKVSDLRIDLGTDYEYRLGDRYLTFYPRGNTEATYSNIRDRHVYEYSGFGQVTYSLFPFHGTLGTRWTNNELFGTNLSSRGSLVYQLNETNSVKLIAGQSYRAPSIFELYFLSPSRLVRGNLDLKPETSDSIELAYLTSFSNLFIQVLGYQANYKNKIDRRTIPSITDPDGRTFTNVRQYANTIEFKARGVELECNYTNPEIVNGFVNAGYVTNEGGEQENFRFVPDYTVSAGLSKEFGNLFCSGSLNYRGSTLGRLDTVAAAVAGDVSVGYKEKNVRHILTVQNVADAPVNYPEYVVQRGNFLNAIPSANSRRILYTFEVNF